MFTEAEVILTKGYFSWNNVHDKMEACFIKKKVRSSHFLI